MTQVSFALPEDDTGWAEARVAAGEFASVDAYFSQLAKRDGIEAEEAERLQGKIDAGLASAVDPRQSAAIFSDIRAKYLGSNA